MKEKIRNVFYMIWYWYISTIDKNAEVVFMNFGFSNSMVLFLFLQIKNI